VDLRKVPKRAPAFHEAHEVPRLLAQLSPVDRTIAATALYAGLREGELFGLEKRDVDLNRRLLTVRRSYDSDTTKGGREEAVPIAASLVPYLEAALGASTGELLFPRSDGGRRTEADKLGKRIQTALKPAGIVEAYLHLCRRCKANGQPHEEKHPDNERRDCPVCGMALWAKPIAKKLRLHDSGTRPRCCSWAPAPISTRWLASSGTLIRRSLSELTRTSCRATCTRKWLSAAVPTMSLAHLLPTIALEPSDQAKRPGGKGR
jgi:hypothetical protein